MFIEGGVGENEGCNVMGLPMRIVSIQSVCAVYKARPGGLGMFIELKLEA